MSRLPERHRKDGNATELVSLWIMLGGQWEWGPPLDGWACLANEWHPTEIKDPKRKGHKDEYTDKQKRFFAKCSLNGSHWWTWRESTDVIQARHKK